MTKRRRDAITEQELRERREREKKDLEVERTHGERPLEGFSHAPHALWPQDTDETAAASEHGHDEARSVKASVRQVTRIPRP